MTRPDSPRSLVERALRGVAGGEYRTSGNVGQAGLYRILSGVSVMPDGAVISAVVDAAQGVAPAVAQRLATLGREMLDRCPDDRLDESGLDGEVWRATYETELAMIQARCLAQEGALSQALEILHEVEPPEDDTRLTYRWMMARAGCLRDMGVPGSLDTALRLVTEATELAKGLSDQCKAEALVQMGTILEAMGADTDRVTRVNTAAIDHATSVELLVAASANTAYCLARDGQVEAQQWLTAAEPLFDLLPSQDHYRQGYRYWVRGLIRLSQGAGLPEDGSAAAADLETAAHLFHRGTRRLELALVGIDLVRAYLVAGHRPLVDDLLDWLLPELSRIGCPADVLQVLSLVSDSTSRDDLTPELIASFHGILRAR